MLHLSAAFIPTSRTFRSVSLNKPGVDDSPHPSCAGCGLLITHAVRLVRDKKTVPVALQGSSALSCVQEGEHPSVIERLPLASPNCVLFDVSLLTENPELAGKHRRKLASTEGRVWVNCEVTTKPYVRFQLENKSTKEQSRILDERLSDLFKRIASRSFI